MDFDLTDEQRLLKDSVDRLVADRYLFENRKAWLKDPTGHSAEMWAQYAELGLLGLPFAEDHGGFGGGGGYSGGSGGGSGGSSGGGSSAPSDDPWGSAPPAGSGAAVDDEPPF